MLKTLSLAVALGLALCGQSFAQQNSNRPASGAAGGRSATTNSSAQTAPTRTSGKESPSEGVVAAFDNLIEGIRRADVNAVTSVYWNSPQLVLFNNNGTVTKGWEQMRKNRESSYPELKDVKIEIRDRRVQMLGRDGALVTCLWTQSQTYRGTPETATGRMTLVFRRVGNAWKAVHLHTSPDAPDPARLLPSEQAPEPMPKPTPKPKTTP